MDIQSEVIILKIKHYLLTTMGRTLEGASDIEFYRALCWSLREEILINWAAANHTYAKKNVRKIYYISMEYMPGRLLGNNLTNLCSNDLVYAVLKKVDRNFNLMMLIEPEIGIGNGGLGRLASCFLDSLATQKYPAIGYGLRYQYGIFEQELLNGVQIERPDCWLLYENPWEFRRDAQAATVHFRGELQKRLNAKGEEVYDVSNGEDVRAIPYDYPIVGFSRTSTFPVTTLRIWSTKESPRNFSLQRYNAGDTGSAAENTSLTDVLYPNDNNDVGKRIRLKQEFLLVSATLQDIIAERRFLYNTIDDFADKVRIQINDTHPSLAVVELIRLFMQNEDKTFDEALDITRTVCSYTNHTVMREALEEWNIYRMQELLPRQYRLIERLNQHFLHEIQARYPDNNDKIKMMSILHSDQVRMAYLTIFCSHKVNGVAKLHTELLKQTVFRDIFEMFPEKFINVTNGVTQRRWLLHCNPLLSNFITKLIGFDWIVDFAQLAKLGDRASNPDVQKEFLKIKTMNKQYLIDHFRPECKAKYNFYPDFEPFLGTEALYDIQIKRIHEYKRQFMAALHMLMLYYDFKENPSARKVKRMLIFGGKAAPGYQLAKNVIRLIYCISRMLERDTAAREYLKVLYIENYNVSKAEVLIPAADVSEQISTASTEASGTGNMKLAINGALTVGTNDGANIEMKEAIGEAWWPFAFGSSAEENLTMARERTYHPQDLAYENPKINRVLEALINDSLTENEDEKNALAYLHESIFEGVYGGAPDRYFILNDLNAYYETHKKVDELYQDPMRWAEFALRNIAGMGLFSTDVSIHNYATQIWDLSPCPTDQEEVNRIREEYQKIDQCRVYPP
ncbi:MAG: glycogen/starch/alpha-glucan family phosphorylase [Simkaniaceae bacterium]|nr:glycogen/starch/alpha-glucan family phosphorylase [Simkaniaceae bacterium]MCF7852579.1 glycogen/starch/alpha-glucan family phosphorylase [Simkaniaceae bacterium]